MRRNNNSREWKIKKKNRPPLVQQRRGEVRSRAGPRSKVKSNYTERGIISQDLSISSGPSASAWLGLAKERQFETLLLPRRNRGDLNANRN